MRALSKGNRHKVQLILSEVEALCDRVGILRDGRLVDEGTLATAAIEG